MQIDEIKEPPPERKKTQRERAEEVRAILRAAGWEPCRIGRWLLERNRDGKRRIEVVNEGGAAFDALLIEARRAANVE